MRSLIALTWSAVAQNLHDYSFILVMVLAVVLGIICSWILRCVKQLQGQLRTASADALIARLAQPAGTVLGLEDVKAMPSRRARERASSTPHDVTAAPGGAPLLAHGAASWFVDYEQVKRELMMIGVTWLGDGDSEPVAELLGRAQPSIDDFVATIDSITTLEVEGHDSSVLRAMALEMQHHAAERLCGA